MLYIAGEHIGLYIDPCPFLIAAKKGLFHGDVDDRQAKRAFKDLVDGKADTVNGDRAFLCYIFGQPGRHLDVIHGDGDAGLGGVMEAEALDIIEHLAGLFVVQELGAGRSDLLEHALIDDLVVVAQLAG